MVSVALLEHELHGALRRACALVHRIVFVFLRLNQHGKQFEAIVGGGALSWFRVEKTIDFNNRRIVLALVAEHMWISEVERDFGHVATGEDLQVLTQPTLDLSKYTRRSDARDSARRKLGGTPIDFRVPQCSAIGILPIKAGEQERCETSSFG